MRMTGCLLCLLGFLAIAVGAQAQGCSTPPCISGITITPNVIPGDNTTTATGTITVNRGQFTDQPLDVEIGIQFNTPTGFRCMPPAVFDYNGGIECNPANCQLPPGVSTLQIELWGSNGSQSPVT